MAVQEFGRIVAKHREAKGYSQSELAEIVNITCSSLASIESGEELPQAETAIRLAAELNISLDALASNCEDYESAMRISKSIEELLLPLSQIEREVVLRTIQTFVTEFTVLRDKE